MWLLTSTDKILYNLGIDLSLQFTRVTNLAKLVQYTTNFDLCATTHTLKSISFTQNNFFAKYCDVKITTIENTQQFYSENLFKTCLFAIQPIYYCLQNQANLFVQQQVSTNLLGKQQIRLPIKYFNNEHIYLVDSLSEFDLNMSKLPKTSIEFWSCFIFSLFTYPLKDYAYKHFIKRWHLENSVALPQLCILDIDVSLHRLLNFFIQYIKKASQLQWQSDLLYHCLSGHPCQTAHSQQIRVLFVLSDQRAKRTQAHPL